VPYLAISIEERFDGINRIYFRIINEVFLELCRSGISVERFDRIKKDIL
jgi:hypothetical protein